LLILSSACRGLPEGWTDLDLGGATPLENRFIAGRGAQILSG
jgi:hypothetical protein